MVLFVSCVVACIASTFSIWLFRPLALRLGFVDKPGGRKTHEENVPLVGGLAIGIGLFFALLSLPASLQPYRAMIAGSALLMLVGIVDDFQGVSPRMRIVVQLAAALIMIGLGHKIVAHLGNLSFSTHVNLGFWAYPFTLMMVIGYINAMNMLDGQDGLSGGVALGQVALLIVAASSIGAANDVQILSILGSLLLVFLMFNMRLPWRARASVFMGDSGITFVAYLIAWFAIDLSQKNPHVLTPMTILWILAFPLLDMTHVVAYRIARGKPAFQASRDHFHHILHVLGIEVGLSTLLLTSFSLGLGLFGLVLNRLQIAEIWQLAFFVVVFMVYQATVRLVRQRAFIAATNGT
jgi:UDP-GlcNAc:undecaprenyl-phosphate/decaprenyl-phosphate GlcNAc-1-phosphate transferase